MNENATPPVVEGPLAAPSALRHSPCRILVVDRDSDLRLLYTDALASPGCRVDVAEDVATAWDALQAHRYHLLVAENDPPDLTAGELIRKLRGASMELPVVMAARGWPMHASALNSPLPFAAMVRKPFVLEALVETVQNALRASVPMRKDPSRRNRRPSPDCARPILPATAYESPSKEQATDVR